MDAGEMGIAFEEKEEKPVQRIEPVSKDNTKLTDHKIAESIGTRRCGKPLLTRASRSAKVPKSWLASKLAMATTISRFASRFAGIVA